MQQWLFDLRSRKFILLLVFFLTLTCLAYTKIIFPLDNGMENYVHSLGHNAAVDLAMQIFTETGWILYLVITSFILLIKKETRRLGLVLLLSIIVGSMLSAYLRCYIGYEAPTLKFEGAHLGITSAADIGVPCTIDGSFPAGHTVRTTIFAFVLGFALSKRFPRGCYLLWIYPILVSMSRVYLMQQFPLDLVGGALLGLLVANIVSRILKLELIFVNQKPNS
ncbi:MAG TPA: phosphatase PAP2 family protein [Nitrosopumilaceae archaeon]|nr:phosphatase PAP2 family protein [Nitrosopumilaceae archaeon]